MAFKDVINNYDQGAKGEIDTLTGDTVGYTVTDGAKTITHSKHGYKSAQIHGNGSTDVEVTFDTPVVGASIAIFGSNSNERYLFEVDGEVVDLNTLVASGEASFLNVGKTSNHKINSDGSISGGHHTDGSVGQVVFHFPVTSLGAVGGGTGGWDGVEIGIDDSSFTTACFAADTALRSPHGWVKACTVRPGDLLWTFDAGLRPVHWVGGRSLCVGQLAAYPNLRPVHIAAGALGRGLPARDLVVSRQHRVLVSSRIAARVTGSADVLLPAVRLLGLDGITLGPASAPIRYVHIMLDGHHLLNAEGAPAESLLCASEALRVLKPEERAELTALCPGAPARPIPSPTAQKAIVARHAKNAQPLLQAWCT